MNKFCTNCGKELVNGTCTCQKTTSPDTNIFQQILSIIKNFFKSPIGTLSKNCKEENFNGAMIIIAAHGISVALFVLALLKELVSTVDSTINGLFGSNDYSSFLGGSSLSVDIPYFKYFIITFIVAVLAVAATASVAYLISDKLFKGKTDIKKMFTLFGLSSIILTAALLLGTIFLFININLGLIILAAGSLLNICYNYKGLEFVCKTEKDKLAYVIVGSILVVGIVVIYLVPQIIF